MKVFIITLGIIIPSVLIYLMVAREMKFKLIKEGVSLKGFIPSLPSFDFKWGACSESAKHRIEFCFLFFLMMVGMAVVTPWVYSWLWAHKGLALFMTLITIGYVIKPPKSTWILKAEILVLLLLGIYSGMSKEHTAWLTEATSFLSDSQETNNTSSETKNKQRERTINVIATQGAFTEVKIPPGTSFTWDSYEGCLVAVMHDGDPGGSIYDCKEDIELGTNLQNLRIGFSSKTETPIKVAVKFTPL